MSSIRNSHRVQNENDSKVTRMDIAGAGILANWRPDELAHISRYDKIVDLILSHARELDRPLDLLEAGIGQCWPLRTLYKSYVVRKSEYVRSYVGVDIDPECAREHPYWSNSGKPLSESAWFKSFNGSVVLQDLTVNPVFPVEDESIDIFYSTEVIEHQKPKAVGPWLENASKKLRSDGLALISTPNHDGSNERLPEDHVYEWGYQELKDLLCQHFDLLSVTGTFIQMRHFSTAQQEFEAGKRATGWSPEIVDVIKKRFGRHWARVVLAAPYPDVSNNCTWILKKKNG